MVNGLPTRMATPRESGNLRLGDDAPPLCERIEAVVRSVLAEMFHQVDARDPGSRNNPNLFAGQLLGLRDAERVVEGCTVIAVAPGTVVTPMALDHLKRRGVAIRWVSHGELVEVGVRGEWGFAVESFPGTGHALRRALLEQEDEVWIEVGSDHREVADWVAQYPHRGAIIVTPEAFVATWRACQVPNVRAATVTDADGVARACRQLGANLLVIEPTGQSIHSLKRLFAAFRRLNIPRIPEGLDNASDRISAKVNVSGPLIERAGGWR